MGLKHDELDTLIDDVAREMTAGTPGDAFTAQILARLQTTRRPVFRSPWLFAPLAAALVVVIATMVSRRPGPSAPASQAGPNGLTLQRAGNEVPLEPPAAAIAEKLMPAAPRVTRGARVVTGLVSDIDALATTSIAVAALDQTPLDPVDSIHTTPLQAPESITIAPIDGVDDSQRRFE